jgi:hypothetical protein
MTKNRARSLTQLAATAAALVLAASAAPFLAHAQSSSATEVIQLVTGEGSVKLEASEDSFCTATSSDHAIAVSVGNRCSSFGTSADVPAPLYVKIAGDRITFREAAKTYVVRDASTIARARELFAPVVLALSQETFLSAAESDLGRKESEAGRDYSPAQVRVSVPDLSAEFQKVEADAKRLSAEGGTQSQLSELQSELGELQSRISEVQAQASEDAARISEEKSQSSLQMDAMSQQMSAMSEQMKTWSSKGHEDAEQAARQVKVLLDQAVANGLAKPE